MPKILPLRENFEDVRALLAHMAEIDDIVGFVGVAVRGDGAMHPVAFGVSRSVFAFAANILDDAAMSEEDTDADRG